jgi:hypothetical protein
MRKSIKLFGLMGLTFGIASCGGSDGSSALGPAAPTAAKTVASTPLNVTMQFAQSHVVPPEGLQWTLGSTPVTTKLHLVGNKVALALVKISQNDAVNPVIEATTSAGSLGTVTLAPPSALGKTEAGGPAFATDLWSADLPASWMVPGVSLTVKASNYLASAAVKPEVGADSSLTLRVLPFYLFGANETNTQPLSVAQNASAQVKSELLAKWPIAKLDLAAHPAGAVIWDRIVSGPRTVGSTKNPAYVLTSMDQQQEGYAVMNAVLGITSKMRAANGEANTDSQYYAPILAIDTGTGRYNDPDGGLGGGGSGTGDYRYAGVFFHEQGHAYGLPHAGEAYTAGTNPYVGGSLKGSAWGYDADRKEFLGPLVPANAKSFANCKTNRQLDANGACYKQDPMQGGSGDQAAGYLYAMLSDFNVWRLMDWFEGTTTLKADGTRAYSGGRLFAEPTGYSRWDSISQKRVMLPADNTVESALYGVNLNLPVTRGVPVYSIAISYSNAGTPGASYIYPPVRYAGNLIRTFDPTSPTDRSDFTVNTGKYAWYCAGSGCDYSVRVTYDDGSVIYRVLKDGFRSWFKPTVAPAATATDPTNNDSFKTWVINVPGTRAITRIEMLDTPMVWTGLPTSPSVLLSR